MYPIHLCSAHRESINIVTLIRVFHYDLPLFFACCLINFSITKTKDFLALPKSNSFILYREIPDGFYAFPFRLLVHDRLENSGRK